MGRPLSKRFFDPASGINGESVASATITNQGSYVIIPAVTFSAPALPDGATAAGSAVMEAATATINSGGTGYTAGDVLVIGGGAVEADTTAGVYTAQTTLVVDTVDGAGVITAFTALSVRGAYSDLPEKVVGGSQAVNLALDGGSGTGATVDVTWRVLSITVSNGGAGYVDAADAAITFDPVSATATAVLTTLGDNVILARAFVVGGTTALESDIVKQTGSSRYVMVNTEDSSSVVLVSTNTPVAGEAYIKATDSLGSTYYVTKLTARLAVLVRWTDGGSGWVHASGTTAPWSFDSSTDASGITVQIENV
jgi:hypothetical protein